MDAVSTGLGHEAVEEGCGRERIEDLPVAATAEWAEGPVPVPNSKGVSNLCAWFSVAGEEAREEGVGL
jgi:hypothetical protein